MEGTSFDAAFAIEDAEDEAAAAASAAAFLADFQ